MYKTQFMNLSIIKISANLKALYFENPHYA